MTAFNFILTEHAVFTLTDSLSLDGEPTRGREPHGFFTKVYPLPHMNSVMVGTGLAQVVLDWFVEIQNAVVSDSIMYLNTIAPSRLQLIASKYKAAMTTTIYHFGLDADAGIFRGFAYRGTNGFKSEELPHSFGIKPPLPEFVQRFPKALEEGSLRDAFVELLAAQKADDEARPKDERVGVGGEAHLLVIWRGRQMLWTCHRFSDYPAVYRQMLKRLEEINRSAQDE